MDMSISFKKATKMSSLGHNNRDFTPKNVDPKRTDWNVTYVQEKIEDVYKELFDDAVMEYNNKQKRKDRKIGNYYEKILSDKATEHQQELLVQIGDHKDFNLHYNSEGKLMGNAVAWKNCENILNEFMIGFQERNPNLRVYNAVLHLDEASPHLHINFVPYHNLSKTGMKTRVGFDKALTEQNSGSFDNWRDQEVEILEKSLKSLSIGRKRVGTHKYLKPDDYVDNERSKELLGDIIHEVMTEEEKSNLKPKQATTFDFDFEEDGNSIDGFENMLNDELIRTGVKKKPFKDILKDAFKEGIRELLFTRSFDKAFEKFQESYTLGIESDYGKRKRLSFEDLIDKGMYAHQPNYETDRDMER